MKKIADDFTRFEIAELIAIRKKIDYKHLGRLFLMIDDHAGCEVTEYARTCINKHCLAVIRDYKEMQSASIKTQTASL
jgi:hypothetical protein